MFSRTLIAGKSRWFWKTKPIPRASGGRRTPQAVSSKTLFPIAKRPASGETSPVMRLASDDFPEPLRPSTAVRPLIGRRPAR